MALDFWERVKVLIKQNGTKQEWIAENSGIKYQTLRSMISKDGLPRVDDAVKIAQALNTSVEFLVTGTNTSVPNQIATFYSSYAKYSVFLEYLSELTSAQIEDMEAMVIALVYKNREKKEAAFPAG